MKITSYKAGAGSRAREKVHQVDCPSVGTGYMRDGLAGRALSGRILYVEFDGRLYSIEMDEKEAADFRSRVLVHFPKMGE